MATFCRWLLGLALLCAAAPRLNAANPTELQAFSAATNAFFLGFYDRAESAFAAFTQTYSNSPLAAEAVLFQAQSRIQQTNFTGAIDLLSARQAAAGTNADQCLFWLAEAHLRKGDYPAATNTFAKLIHDFPSSARYLEAAIGEATARTKLSDWPGVIQALQRPDGAFQTAVRSNVVNELVACGYVLLSEAQLAQKDYPGAEAALQPLAKLPLGPYIAWQRQYLLCQIQLAKGQLEAALVGSTNLTALAIATGQRAPQAESAALRGELLERLGRVDEAIAAYELNLAETVPAERQRQALWKMTALSLRQNRVPEAARVLQHFLDRYPQARSADMALLTLGEVRLRQYVSGLEHPHLPGASTNTPAGTNFLQLAAESLEQLPKRFPDSALLGKARLNLGWCFWLSNNLPECETNFQAAAERLPLSPDQAVAYFKLADTQFRLKDYAGALTNYSILLERFRALPEVATNLFEPALYQCVQAALAKGDLHAATNALAALLTSYPAGYHTDRAVLLAEQQVGRQGNPALARQLFSEFLKAVPQSPLRPEVELAIARTFEQQDQWTNAIAQYNQWLSTFTNSPARAQAEFYRAQAAYRTQDLTNALTLFTNFVARFPANQLTPLAQLWVGDYYFRAGSFVDAEKNYKWLLQTNWPASEMTYQAQMMAGRAAFARQAWDEAKGYFTNLYNTTDTSNCPTELRIRALLACADCYMSQDSTNKAADYQDAFKYFNRICEAYPTNSLTALAWGGKANALLQWAKTTQLYDEAALAFVQVISATNAAIAARSQAKLGLAIVLEKQAELTGGTNRVSLLKQALNHSLDVFTGTLLRPGEAPDPFWRKEAGVVAGRLAEQLQLWEQAKNVYSELKSLVPALGPKLEISIRRCEEHRAGAKN